MADYQGPSAFPSPDERDAMGCGIREGSPGMDLRDYFAAHAPEPTAERITTERQIDRNRNPHNDAHKPTIRSNDQIRAELAYRYADAMLVARSAPQEGAQP